MVYGLGFGGGARLASSVGMWIPELTQGLNPVKGGEGGVGFRVFTREEGTIAGCRV